MIPIIKTKKQKIFASVILILLLVGLFCLSVFIYTKYTKPTGVKNTHNDWEDLTYDQVVRSKQQSDGLGYYKSSFDGKEIFWPAKISNYYTQNSGIKFCIYDKDHQDININEPCDWFWASSEETKNSVDTSNDTRINYILNYYKVPLKKDYDNDYFWIKGTVTGIDCSYADKCVPDISIISILEMSESF